MNDKMADKAKLEKTSYLAWTDRANTGGLLDYKLELQAVSSLNESGFK